MLDDTVQRHVLDDLELPHAELLVPGSACVLDGSGSASTASSWGSAARSPSSMPGIVSSIASTLENRVTMVRREPADVASKLNLIDDGMFSSSALSSPSTASKELMGVTAVNFHEPLHFSPSCPLRK